MNSVSIIVLSRIMLVERARVLVTSNLNLSECPGAGRVALGRLWERPECPGGAVVASSGAKSSDKLLIFNTGFMNK